MQKDSFYALQTIRQLLPASIEKEEVSDKKVKWSIPAVSIQDEPRFGYRALLLDASRFFIPQRECIAHYRLYGNAQNKHASLSSDR